MTQAKDTHTFIVSRKSDDPLSPARGIINGIVLAIPAWLAIIFIYKLCVLVYWIGVESYWRSFS